LKALDLKHIFHEKLDAIYGEDEVAQFFYLSLETCFDIAKIQLALEPEFTLTKDETSQLFEILEDLIQQKPIQYILGETEFYGLKFRVNPHVLIPRQETEELVDWILKDIKLNVESSKFHENHTNPKFRILDIGTGSGCIAISLAKHLPNAKVYALDISESALKVAKQNAELNNVNIKFLKCDILDSSLWEDVRQSEQMGFNIIVSNPPYVRQLEKTEIKPNVLDNEPHLALFVDNAKPLVFYKAITTFASIYLKPKGQLYFEINQYLGEETQQLLVDAGFQNIELRNDINGNDRMLKGERS